MRFYHHGSPQGAFRASRMRAAKVSTVEEKHLFVEEEIWDLRVVSFFLPHAHTQRKKLVKSFVTKMLKIKTQKLFSSAHSRSPVYNCMCEC